MADHLFKNRGNSSALTFKKWADKILPTMPYQEMIHLSATAAIQGYMNDLTQAINMCKTKRAGATTLKKVFSNFEKADKVNIIIMAYSY
jgi:hypothetical protein